MSTAEVPGRMRISVERYLKMVATGVLTEEDRVELIEGDLLTTPPIGPPHSAVVALLTKILGPTPDGWFAQRDAFAAGEVVAPRALPAVQVPVSSLFG